MGQSFEFLWALSCHFMKGWMPMTCTNKGSHVWASERDPCPMGVSWGISHKAERLLSPLQTKKISLHVQTIFSVHTHTDHHHHHQTGSYSIMPTEEQSLELGTNCVICVYVRTLKQLFILLFLSPCRMSPTFIYKFYVFFFVSWSLPPIIMKLTFWEKTVPLTLKASSLHFLSSSC